MDEATIADLLLEKWLRSRNSGQLCWKTRDGRAVPLKDMSDKHLQNALDMLNRDKAEEDAFLSTECLDYD